MSNLTGSGGAYPSKDIVVNINWSAGGATDAYARNVTGVAVESLGVSPNFKNITGSGGLRGAQATLNSEPDGYTMGSMAPPLVPISALVQDSDVDLTRLVPVAGYSAGTYGLWTLPKHGVSTMDGILEKYQSGEFTTIGLQGSGDSSEITALLMKDSDEYNLAYENAVSYGGSAAAAKALISEEVPAIIASDGGVRNYYRNDQIDGVAMLHSEGSALFDDIPPVTDSGYPTWDYVSRFTRGMVLPPETSTEKRDTLEQAIKEAGQSDEVSQWTEKTGNPVSFQGHEKFGAAIKNSFEKIPEVVDINSLSK